MVTAWYYADTPNDPREEHQLKPSIDVGLSELESIGVLSWHFDPLTEMHLVEGIKS